MNLFYRSILLLFGLLCLNACGDPESAYIENLTPTWSFDISRDTMRINAEGKVLDDFFTVRLTDGDYLRVGHAGERWHLYRRNADFIYHRRFSLSDDDAELQAELVRAKKSFDNVLISIPIPETRNVLLVEENQTIPDTGTFNLSWDLDTAVESAIDSEVTVELLTCDNQPGATQTRIISAPMGVRTFSINAAELPGELSGVADRCYYTLQLNLMHTIGNPVPYTMNSRSRKFAASVDFDGVLL